MTPIEAMARALCELRIRRARKWDTDQARVEEMLPAAVDHAWPEYAEEALAALRALRENVGGKMLDAAADEFDFQEGKMRPSSYSALDILSAALAAAEEDGQ